MSEVGKEDVMAAFVNALSTQIQCRLVSHPLGEGKERALRMYVVDL